MKIQTGCRRQIQSSNFLCDADQSRHTVSIGFYPGSFAAGDFSCVEEWTWRQTSFHPLAAEFNYRLKTNLFAGVGSNQWLKEGRTNQIASLDD